jgi:hypothetical protein
MANRGKTFVDAAQSRSSKSEFATDTPSKLASSSLERFCGTKAPPRTSCPFIASRFTLSIDILGFCKHAFV